MITTCANKVDQLDFESHVRDTIQYASNPQMLVFEKGRILNAAGQRSLVESFNTGDLTGYEQTQIGTLVGTTLEFRSGP
ncbi:hypothetical protein N7535_001351 [Penicillium sp. DV-2018c]|nr:hypothetical protein N7535_001351 [Penicillium sp. DV-2018c]